MSNEATYPGKCFCGAVHIEVRGAPAVMGYCHCNSCRSWSAGPINAFSLWKMEAVRVTHGAEHVARYKKTELSGRAWCTLCGGHLFTEHAPWELTDVYAATLPSLQFTPAVHVHYQETVLRMRDGLPKFKDIPKDMGGSGETLPE